MKYASYQDFVGLVIIQRLNYIMPTKWTGPSNEQINAVYTSEIKCDWVDKPIQNQIQCWLKNVHLMKLKFSVLNYIEREGESKINVFFLLVFVCVYGTYYYQHPSVNWWRKLLKRNCSSLHDLIVMAGDWNQHTFVATAWDKHETNIRTLNLQKLCLKSTSKSISIQR